MKASNRDEAISDLAESLFAAAQKTSDHSLELALKTDLEIVFATDAWGFREILFLVGVERLRNPAYKASEDFYSCNPRTLYEGPLRNALLRHGIPCRKSGPLNIAKAAQAINEEWAAHREPAAVGMATVRLIKKIEALNPRDLESFMIGLCKRYLLEATRIQELAFVPQPDAEPTHLFMLCGQLIVREPDGGNTPQKIVGLLLEAYHKAVGSGVVVDGHHDSAHTTSTTSKKWGDITEISNGILQSVYEVTVKSFNETRLKDSYESIRACDDEKKMRTSEVLVICRKADVIKGAVGGSGLIYLGAYACQDLLFHFLEINEWIQSQLLRMPVAARLLFHKQLTNYIAEPNTSEKVKRCWRDLNNA